MHNGPGGTTANIDMRCLRVAERGAVLWWSLPSLYRMFCGDEHMDFGRFKNKRWTPWKSFLAEADFDYDCLLISCRNGLGSADDGRGPRCEFDFACADTRAMLLLVLRFCSAHGQTGRVDVLAESAAAFVQSLFSLVSGNIRVASGGRHRSIRHPSRWRRHGDFPIPRWPCRLESTKASCTQTFRQILARLAN